jgi:hypothetical protein
MQILSICNLDYSLSLLGFKSHKQSNFMTHAFRTLLILRAALVVPTIILCNSDEGIVEYLILLK